MNWTVTNGTVVHTNQVLGWIKGVGGGGQAQHSIKSPGNGTVAINNAVNGEVVSAGTELATAYNFNDIYVTARVADTDIRDVHVGKQVDISVDSSPKTPVTGIVQEIQNSAADSSPSTPARTPPEQPAEGRPVRAGQDRVHLLRQRAPVPRPERYGAHPQELTQLRGPGQLRW